MLVYIGIRGNSDFTMIQLITTSFFLLSAFQATPAIAADMSTISTSSAVNIALNTTDGSMSDSQKAVRQEAIKFFKDDPILVQVARCESSFRQVDEDGKILRGKANRSDVGLMQINEYYHKEKATSLGMNLRTIEGNMAYAKYLYDKEGLTPWASSKACWGIQAPANQVALK